MDTGIGREGYSFIGQGRWKTFKPIQCEKTSFEKLPE